MSKYLIIDGTNVCYWSSSFSMSPLVRLASEVTKAGYDLLCIFDASTPYKFDKEKGINDRAAYRQLIQLYPNLFSVAPSGIRADEFILLLADKQGSSVVSNDRFRDYEERYAWLVNDTNRLVKGQLMGGTLVIPKLGITASVGNNLTEELDELKSMLPTPQAISTGPRIPNPPQPLEESTNASLAIPGRIENKDLLPQKITLSGEPMGNVYCNISRVTESTSSWPDVGGMPSCPMLPLLTHLPLFPPQILPLPLLSCRRGCWLPNPFLPLFGYNKGRGDKHYGTEPHHTE